MWRLFNKEIIINQGQLCCNFTIIFIKKFSQDQADLPEDGVEIEKRVFDEENDLPFKDNSLDLVASSLKYHKYLVFFLLYEFQF